MQPESCYIIYSNLPNVKKANDELKKHFANDVEHPVEDFEPPQVPRFWHFAPLTLRSEAIDVQEIFFRILHDLDVDVEAL